MAALFAESTETANPPARVARIVVIACSIAAEVRPNRADHGVHTTTATPIAQAGCYIGDMIPRLRTNAAVVLLSALAISLASAAEPSRIVITDLGATGDGNSLQTRSIQ